jgi:hypothetical protein
MTDHRRRRSKRTDDNLVPLLMGALVVATVGPAVLNTAKRWLAPRSEAVGLTLAEWWNRNWWLAAFWAVELVGLLAYLWWTRRRDRRRRVQLESVTAALSRVLPSDWDARTHLRVLRWQGYRPVRLRLFLTPRSPLTDSRWQRSLVTTLGEVLGRLEPFDWPRAPAGSVITWGARLPALEIRVRTDPAGADEPTDPEDSELDEAGASADQPRRRPFQLE